MQVSFSALKSWTHSTHSRFTHAHRTHTFSPQLTQWQDTAQSLVHSVSFARNTTTDRWTQRTPSAHSLAISFLSSFPATRMSMSSPLRLFFVACQLLLHLCLLRQSVLEERAQAERRRAQSITHDTETSRPAPTIASRPNSRLKKTADCAVHTSKTLRIGAKQSQGGVILSAGARLDRGQEGVAKILKRRVSFARRCREAVAY